MSETPLLMRADMVRALLADEKSETRRTRKLDVINESPKDWRLISSGLQETRHLGKPARFWWGAIFQSVHDMNKIIQVKSPYGRPNDRIWIKETWRPYGWGEAEPFRINYRADNAIELDRSEEDQFSHLEYRYAQWHEDTWINVTDECEAAGVKHDEEGNFDWDTPADCPIKWRPSIFMPRWCSRIDLHILDIRIERLKDITPDGAWAEGLRWKNPGPLYDPVTDYLRVWTEINGKVCPAYKNPWVWVIKFKRISK